MAKTEAMMNDPFLPKDYKEPEVNGSYFKVKAGETHRVRIMGSFKFPSTAIMGWVAWTNEGQPIRKEYTTNGYDKLTEIDRDKNPRHFWLFQIWHEDQQNAQIWEITQRTIMSAIRTYTENPAWGDPRNYVFSISRTGEGFDTKYSVIAEPPVAPPDETVQESLNEARIDCREIFRGENPFGALTDEEADGMPF